MGKHIVETWYFSPLPREIWPRDSDVIDLLYVCFFFLFFVAAATGNLAARQRRDRPAVCFFFFFLSPLPREI
jgi:hypothetical protein